MLIQKFARDSPLEEDGFELSVPLARELFDSHIEEAAKKSTSAVSNDNAPSPRGTVGSKSPSL
jgi:hypothetical protein